MKIFLFSVIFFLLPLIFTLQGKAQIIDFAWGGTPNSGQGVVGGGTDTWNAITQDGTTSSDLTSTGSATSITFTDNSGFNYSSPSAAFIPLLTSYLGENNGSTITETLHNVSAGTYNLYLYAQNGSYTSSGNFDDRGSVFTLGGVSHEVINTHADSSLTSGANYTEFTNITLATTGSITFTYTTPSGSDFLFNGEADFNGLQLVYVSSVPELPTYMLTMFGLGLLMLMRVGQFSMSMSGSFYMSVFSCLLGPRTSASVGSHPLHVVECCRRRGLNP